jgi:6-phosphogluconolactonase
MARILRSRRALTLMFAVLALNGCGGSGGSSFYFIGGTVSGLVGSRLTLQNNGSMLTIEPAANGFQPLFPHLPNGASYDITVATQPTTPSQTCVVTNGTGTITSADAIDIAVICTTTPARFLLGEGPGACISVSAIDSTSGALSATSASPSCFELYYDRGGGLDGTLVGPMVVDPQGRFLYMAVYQGQIGLLPVFALDRSSGALTVVQATGSGPMGLDFVAFDPSGEFLFTAGTHSQVDTLTVDSTSGTFTDTGSQLVQNTTSAPVAVSVDPLERFVYVAYEELDFNLPSQNMVMAFTLDSKSGALSQVAPPVAIGAPYADGGPLGTIWLAPHPSGNFLYAGSAASNSFDAYSVDPTDGTLTPISGSPFSAGNGPSAAALDPYGKYLYVTNSNSNDISAYSIDPDSGALKPIAGSPFPTGSAPSSIAVEPLGHFVYVGDAIGVSAYQIDARTGALTPISGSPFTFAYGSVISY